MPDDKIDVSQPEHPIGLEDVAGLLREILARLDAGSPEGLPPVAAANYLGVSLRTIHRLNDTAMIPDPSSPGIDSSVRLYSRSVLRAWLIAGCPSRLKWREMQSVAMRRAA